MYLCVCSRGGEGEGLDGRDGLRPGEHPLLLSDQDGGLLDQLLLDELLGGGEALGEEGGDAGGARGHHGAPPGGFHRHGGERRGLERGWGGRKEIRGKFAKGRGGKILARGGIPPLSNGQMG